MVRVRMRPHLVPHYHHKLALPLQLNDDWLQSLNHVQVRFTRGVAERSVLYSMASRG